MKNYFDTMIFYRKALTIQEETSSTDDATLATVYSNIAVAYDSMDKNGNVLQFYHRALTVRKRITSLPPNHLSLASIYSSIASIYLSMERKSDAITFYEKS